jgi:peptide/nickel transport system substrate-binding protein
MPFEHSKALSALAALALASVLVAGCAPTGSASPPSGGSGSEPVDGGSIIVGGLATKALDPGQVGFGTQSLPWTHPIYGSLFEPPTDPGGDLLPGLASGYEYSDDNLELTITLRPDLTFQDGTPMDADAVVWNFNRHIENVTREAQFFVDVESVKATDKTTVVVTFSQPQQILLDALAYAPSGFIASPTAFEKMGADAFNISPVGAGPFKITRVDPGQELVLEKADTYWDADNVHLDGITFLNTGPDPQAALVQLQSESIQSITWAGTYTSAAVLSAAENDPGLSVIAGPSTRMLILPVNTFSPPFDDLKARQAISYCMDREAIATHISDDFAQPAFVLSGDSLALKTWQEGRDLNPLQPDVKKGTELVKELGGLKFTIVTPLSTEILPALQQQWAECGIDAQVQRTDDWLSLVQSGKYQSAMAVLGNDSFNPASASTSYVDPDAANNKFGFRDEAVWDDILKAKGIADEAEATTLWRDIWSSLATNGFVNPIVSGPQYVVVSADLKDVTPSRGYGDFTHAWLDK